MSKTKILLTILLTVITQVVMAQSKVISGTVEDAMGPVMMANVVERDANNRIVSATQTDMMGNFSMEIKNPKNKLVVSYVGSKTLVMNIGDQTTFALKLEDEKTTLTEVTVKGRRGSAGGLNIDKREISISQQTFNLEDVEGMAFTSADEALQGEIAGLDIVSNSGNLGSGTTMRLRGVSSLNGNSQPLIVVDDKIFDYNSDDIDIENADNEAFSSLLAINVDDIADITVLKDAAATAIWGSNGANGVIQIKTKRGSRGKPKVAFGYKFTGTWMPAGYTLLNGDNYTMMLKEAIYNKTQDVNATTDINEINYKTAWADYHNWNKNTDWVDAIKQFGDQHDVTFNINGGGEKATFRISAGYNRQSGTVIKQVMNRLTTRLVLDYNVSDRIRFSTNFALTYNDNLKNNTTGSSKGNNSILAMALSQAPNSSIYYNDPYGRATDQYFLMNPVNGTHHSTDGQYTSYELSSLVGIGNPVAYANMAWAKEKVYSIVPDFAIKYELLGTGADQHRLTFNGRVYFDIYANSKPTYRPGSLTNGYYTAAQYNFADNAENNTFKLGARAELIYTPYFKNKDLSLTMLARYECNTSKFTYQYVAQNQIPTGIELYNVIANGTGMSNQPGTTRAASQNFVYNSHFSYKGRYSLSFSLRGDGTSKFGPKNPWFISPSVSARYNIIDEAFMEKVRKYVSMLALRASWGITGSSNVSVDNYFNSYTNSSTQYAQSAIVTMSGMKLDDLRPQKKTGVNFGANFGFLNDKLEVDVNVYNEKTKDLLMAGIPLPTSTAWGNTTRLSWGNVGVMTNKGWELSVNGKKFVTVKKVTLSAGFNLAQNSNKLKEMDQRVLDNLNTEPNYQGRGYYSKPQDNNTIGSNIINVEIGDPMSSIYGFKYLGVYQYTYEHLKNLKTQNNWNAAQYEAYINEQLAQGYTFPVATDENGKVIMNSNGDPVRMTYYAGEAATDYEFQGGDAIYEDVNHDGTINKLDYQYLGNSLPKMQGGFSLTAQYGNWKMVARFTFRYGNKLVNIGRMNLESMFGTENQCASVAYRWRKDGDGSDGTTVLPRALWNAGYNYQISSRNVEDGSFLRFQNLQVSYSFPKKAIKKWGLSNLSAYFTMNNLFCWTKYTGIDPEVSASTYAPAYDVANTPRAKSFTASLNFGF